MAVFGTVYLCSFASLATFARYKCTGVYTRIVMGHRACRVQSVLSRIADVYMGLPIKCPTFNILLNIIKKYVIQNYKKS